MSYQLQVRIEDDIKQPFEKICSDLGLTMSGAVNIFAKAVIRKNGIPFDLTVSDPFYSESNINWIKESINQMEKGKGAVYNDVSEILAERA